MASLADNHSNNNTNHNEDDNPHRHHHLHDDDEEDEEEDEVDDGYDGNETQEDILKMLMMMQHDPTGGTAGGNTIVSTHLPILTSQHQTASSGSSSTMICSRCGVSDICDLQVTTCGCCFHARCFPLTLALVPLGSCPSCRTTVTSVRLLPMQFHEMEQAKAAAALAAAQLCANSSSGHKRRGQKRKQATLVRIHPELLATVSANANAAVAVNHHNNTGGGLMLDVEQTRTTASLSSPTTTATSVVVPQAATTTMTSLSASSSTTTTSVATTTPTTTTNNRTATSSESSDLRTGRWTVEETAYCDKLMELFEAGQLPLADGMKLHDFLSQMLKSKQSRLTKKMKKAKLSSRSYARTSGYIVQVSDAKLFSELESRFFISLYCTLERSEIRFHMQRQWREQFSSYCVTIGQPLDAEDWLCSVDEMDRRESQARDAARKYRRKLMMGHALRHDNLHREHGVHIENQPSHFDTTNTHATNHPPTRGNSSHDETTAATTTLLRHHTSPTSTTTTPAATLSTATNRGHIHMDPHNSHHHHGNNITNTTAAQLRPQQSSSSSSSSPSSSPSYPQRSATTTTTNAPTFHRSAPFLSRVVQYMQRHSIPFEHVDAWVPSFSSNTGNSKPATSSTCDNNTTATTCRLCYAGCGTTETKIEVTPSGMTTTKTPVPLTTEDRFNLVSFGEYSQKFSFDVGCGMPGRVYQSGMASWEQSIQNAPQHHFERCGGAAQWGIQTVLAIPVPSPNVGRIIVLFYSLEDRVQDVDVVTRLSSELIKLVPAPKWKLVVDIGVSPFESESNASNNGSNHPTRPVDSRISKLLNLIVSHMPADKASPHATFLPGFTSLKMILQEAMASSSSLSSTNTTGNPSNASDEMLQIVLSSAAAYAASGRSGVDIAWMTARDYMLLSQQQRRPPLRQQQQQLMNQVFMSDLLSLSLPSNSNNNGVSCINNTNLLHNNHTLVTTSSISFDQPNNNMSITAPQQQHRQQVSSPNLANMSFSPAVARQIFDPNNILLQPGHTSGNLGFNWSLS